MHLWDAGVLVFKPQPVLVEVFAQVDVHPRVREMLALVVRQRHRGDDVQEAVVVDVRQHHVAVVRRCEEALIAGDVRG